MKKNVGSQLISAQMLVTSTGAALTTGTVAVAVEVDGVSGTGGNATHVAAGKWEFSPIAGDTNGDHITFQFTEATAITQLLNVYTTFPQTADNDTKLTTITGSDGATLATAQALYAPAKVADLGTVQTADHTAAIADIPTVAEFNARTLVAANYTVVSDLGTVQTADHTAAIAAVKAETALIVADTGELQTDWVDGGRLDNLLDGAASAGDPWTTALPGAYGAGTAGEIIGDWKDAGRLDAILDIIAADTTTDIPALIAALDVVVDRVEADTQDIQTNLGNPNVTLADDVLAIPTTAMRGTDSAALATVCTEARLAELDASGLPADIAAISAGASPFLLQSTTITGLSSQTVFNLVAGSTDDDAYNGAMVIITDAATATQKAIGTIGDYVGATKTVTLLADPAIFTIDDTDLIDVIAGKLDEAQLQGAALAAINAYDPPTKAEMDTAHGLLATPTQVNTQTTAALDAISTTALARFMSVDSGETVGVSGSVAKIAQGAGGDPWSTVLPGAYGAGSAGEILGDWIDAGRLDALLDARATQTSVDAISTTLGAVTAITTPATSRAAGSTLNAFIGETTPFPALTPRDVDGTVLDTTAITLQVIIEGRTSTDVATIADGSITKTSTTIQFSGPAAANTTLGQKQWAARRTDNNVVVAHGPYVVDYAPQADA